MTSVRNSNGSYTSKKMTLNALADYVNSKSDDDPSTPTKSYIGGPLIYDTEYEDTSDLKFCTTGGTGNTTEIVDMEFPCDCRILFSILDNYHTPDMKIDDQQIDVQLFPGPLSLSSANETVTIYAFYHVIDIKKGQRVTI